MLCVHLSEAILKNRTPKHLGISYVDKFLCVLHADELLFPQTEDFYVQKARLRVQKDFIGDELFHDKSLDCVLN